MGYELAPAYIAAHPAAQATLTATADTLAAIALVTNAAGNFLGWGIATSFPRSVRLEEGEVVVLSWATYSSRAHRDEVIERARDDPWHAQFEHGEMPFDTRRMYFGGFEQAIAFPP